MKASCRTPMSSANDWKRWSRFPTLRQLKTQHSKLIVTSVTALLQKTFAPAKFKDRTRALERGDKIAPLDLLNGSRNRATSRKRRSRKKAKSPCAAASWMFFRRPVRGRCAWNFSAMNWNRCATSIRSRKFRARKFVSHLAAGRRTGILKQSAMRSRRRTANRRSPRCWIICRAKPFFCFANRNSWPNSR